LLQDSDDALRTVVGLLDDVAPDLAGPAASPLDLHLAIAILDRIYELESASEPGGVSRFRRSVGTESDRFFNTADAEGP
jgi:hypothetical protein